MPLRPILLAARPADPYLTYRVGDDLAGPVLVDGDHVAFLRSGRRTGEVWLTALGEESDRVLRLVDELLDDHEVDGIHVHDDVYLDLPERLRIPDPGWWSIWTLAAGRMSHDGRPSESVVDLDRQDPRIDSLLAHSESAYLFAGDEKVLRWVGIEDGDRLVAVAGQSQIADGTPHLVSICVHPDRRGEGLGRAVTANLARRCLAEGADEVYLEMYAGNLAAARTYGGLGFVQRARYRSGFLPGRGYAPSQ